MQRRKRDITGWLARSGGIWVNLAWLATIVFAAGEIWPILGGPVWMNGLGLLALAFPALAGFVLYSRLDRTFERFALALFWTAMAASVTALGGGVTGAGVLAFLLPPAVAAASGSRDAIIRAAALSGFAALIVGGLQGAGFLRANPTAIELQLPFMLGTVLVIALGFSCAALRAIRDGDSARREAEHGRIRGLAFDASPAALIACDQDGHVLAASQGVRTLSPGLPRLMTDLPLADLGFDTEDRVSLAAVGRKAFSGDVTEYISVRGGRGRAETVRLDAAPIHGGCVAVLARDGSVVAENAVREAEEAKRRAVEETRAKSQYLASVSHELRTPLNAIIGFSDVMKARLFGPLPARYAEYADLIHESGQHLMDLIGDVLDMSKIEAERYELSLEEFDVDEVVGIVVKLMRLQAEEAGLSLTTQMGDEPIRVRADRKALRQMLLNLLSNAVKFTPRGGAVVVMGRASGQELVLAVGDSGPGLDAADVERLGSPYQQASNARESEKRSTGLGLSLVKALAELHDGHMSLTSRKGEGTTVTLSLPVLVEARGQIDSHPAMDVRSQIERAREAGETIASASGAA